MSKLTETDLAVLEKARLRSLEERGHVYVDAVVAMGSDCKRLHLMSLMITSEYSLASNVAVFENGVRL